MIKVVIADDEERVCRLIQALVDWDALNMQIIGTASNGLQAIELIRYETPDILITDIRMPGCNGLELIERARKLCPNVYMIIISGYAHFEYAQTAIKYGVGDYLLKPINKKELTDTLTKIKELIEENRKTLEESETMKKGREKDMIKLRRVLIQELLDKKEILLTEEIIRGQYHWQVKPGCYQGFCVKLDYTQGKVSEMAIEIIWEKLSKIIDTSLDKYCYEWVIMPSEAYVYGVMNYAPKQREEVRKMLRSCLNQMEAQTNLLGEVEFTFGLGKLVTSPKELQESLMEARQAVMERLMEGTGKLIEFGEAKPALYEQKLLDKYDRNMNHALEMISTEELKSAIGELKQSVMETVNAQGWEVLEVVKSAGEMFAMRLDIPSNSSVLLEFIKQCHHSKSMEELFEALLRFESSIMEEMLYARKQDTVRPIRIAKQYIQSHYSEQITLEEVSEQVGLSPAYFSALFKKESEHGFARYLMNVRMEQAKILLRETNLSVVEICNKVGYNDKKHFTHTFEKTVGLKPIVYRKLYG